MHFKTEFKIVLRPLLVILFGCIPAITPSLAQEPNADAGQAQDQSDDAQDDVENETAKLSTETWNAYVDRLVSLGHLTRSQRQSWSRGEEVIVTKAFHHNRVRMDTRETQIPKQRLRTEERDGKIITVSDIEMVTQAHDVPIYDVQTYTCTLTLPLVGFETDDTEFDGFLTEDGEPIVTKLEPLPPVAIPENSPVDPTVATRKKRDENWEAYFARLVESRYLSEAEVDHWKAGNPLAIYRQMPYPKNTN